MCCSSIGYAAGLSFVKSYADLPFANPKVWDIEAMAANDWVFLGTDNGILAFDGNLWDYYHLDNKSEVRSSTFDSEGKKLYVGGINEFGYLSPSVSGMLEYTCLSDSVPEKKFVGNIWGIHKAGNTLYVQGDQDILIYDMEEPSVSLVVRSGKKINCSALIGNTLYLGTETGVCRLKSGEVVEIAGMEELNKARIRSIMPGMNGIIVTTASAGVFLYKNGVARKLDFTGEVAGELFTAAANKEMLALGTIGNGLYLINLKDNSIAHYNESNGLVSNTILSLSFDTKGNLWIGEDGGVEQAIVKMPMTTLSNARMQIGHGYTSIIHAGRLWLGTNRGLYSLPWPLNYPLEIEKMPGIEGQTWNLRKIGDKLLLCHDHGLFEVVSANKYKASEGPTGVWDIQVVKSNPDKVVIGAYDGLYLGDVANGVVSNVRKIEGYTGSPNFVQDNETDIWVSEGTEGFSRLRIDYDACRVVGTEKYATTTSGESLKGYITASEVDGRPLFFAENGVYRFDDARGGFVIDEAIAPYLKPGRKFLGINETGNWIYLVTDNEFLQVNVVTNEVSSMPLFNDRIISRHYGNMIHVVDETTVVLPTSNGYIFAEFSPEIKAIDKLSRNPGKINAMFTTNVGDSLLYRANYLDARPKIELDYSHNSIKVVFGNMALSRNGVIQYRYKLNDEKWSAISPVNVKEFTELDAGDYTFAIETLSGDGVVSTDEISFSIRPPWWLSNAALIIYFVLLLGLIVLIAWIVRRRVEKRERELVKEQEAEILRQKLEFQEKERQQQAQIAELEREKMQHDYNRKSQELTNLLMSEANKNDILQEVKDELNKAMNSPMLSADQRAIIGKLYEKIKLGSHTEKVLERVEEEFNLLHNNFTQKLRQSYPSLTNSEVMLCTYIKMNLPTKEIAPLINISLRGVETMRYRVRKKLGLNRDDSLSGFIANF